MSSTTDAFNRFRGLEPAVTAVVVNYNGGERVLAALKAVTGQSCPPASVVLVDNGSADGSADAVARRFPDITVLQLGANRGPAAARNKGLELATSDLVLLLDADIYLQDDCLARLRATYEAERPSVVCPRILLHPEDLVHCDGAAMHFIGNMALRNGYQPLSAVRTEARALVQACGSACLLVDRRCVLAAGGFDTLYFFYFEDLEFSFRLSASGHRILYEPSAVVRHDRRRGTPGLSYRGVGTYPPQRVYLTLRNRLLTIGIHFQRRTLLVLAPALALYETAALITCLARGWGKQWLRAWAWQVKNAPAIRERRRRNQRTRVLSDQELIVGGPLPFAPGFARSRLEKAAVKALSAVLDAYWRLARGLL